MRRLLAGICLMAVAGCGGTALPMIESADRVTLYKLDPKGERPAEAKPGSEFRGYPVKYSMALDKDRAKTVLDALKEGSKQGALQKKDAANLKEFAPTVGLQGQEEGKSLQFLLSFESGQFEHWYNEGLLRRAPFSDKVQPIIEKILADGVNPNK